MTTESEVRRPRKKLVKLREQVGREQDKDEIARPLADALIARSVTVWFDELNVRVGQSIRREIEAKQWT